VRQYRCNGVAMILQVNPNLRLVIFQNCFDLNKTEVLTYNPPGYTKAMEQILLILMVEITSLANEKTGKLLI
jgi:hypothetical protein